LTAVGNKSGQQLRKRAEASTAFVSHHQADELSPYSSPLKPEQGAECSGCHPAEHSDMGNPAEARRATQVFNGECMLKCVAGPRPKGLAPCSLQLLGSQGRYCNTPCGRQFLSPWVTGGHEQNVFFCGFISSCAQGFLYTQNEKANKRKPEKFNLVWLVCL